MIVLCTNIYSLNTLTCQSGSSSFLQIQQLEYMRKWLYSADLCANRNKLDSMLGAAVVHSLLL